MTAVKRFFPASLLVLVLFGLISADLGAGEKIPLRVGFHLDRTRFETKFAEKDVMVATQVLFEKVLAGSGEFEPNFRIFRSEAEYLKAIVAGELDYVEFGPLFWLRLPEEIRNQIKPVSVVQMGEKRLDRFVLLAAPGETLETLAGKRVRVETGSDRGIGAVWVNYELQQAGLPVIEEHFGKVHALKKASDVLLPTFFGKADACIVREDDYNVASELNPQISQRLVPLKTSPEVPLILTGVAGPNRETIRARLGGSPEFITEQSGAQQAFALLRIKDVSPYKNGDMDSLKAIVEGIETTTAITAVEPTEEEE